MARSMKTCRNCIHYKVCEYSTIVDKEVNCKDYLPKDLLEEFTNMLTNKADLIRINAFDSKWGISEKDIDEILKEMENKYAIRI